LQRIHQGIFFHSVKISCFQRNAREAAEGQFIFDGEFRLEVR
jgi:hypothetical protein